MSEPASTPAASTVSRGRLEFLFDGIFAIAMTLLVLEVKVPELADRHSVRELAGVLVHHGSSFFSYFLSFAMLGIFWYRHNNQFRHFERITPAMALLHMVQLSMAAFFPFCAGTFGHYPSNYLAMSLYSGCILAYMGCTTALWWVARRAGATGAGLTPQEYRRHATRNLRGLALIGALFAYYAVMALANRGA